MEDNIFKYLDYQKKVLQDLLELARIQQTALVHFDMNSLEEITAKQDANQMNLRKAEDLRIKFIIEWLGISRTQASTMKLSEFAHYVSFGTQYKIAIYKDELNKLINELNVLNTTNRILANRAKNSVNTMLNMLTDGNTVCNVKI